MVSWLRFYEETLAQMTALDVVHDIGAGVQPVDRKRFKRLVTIDVNESFHPDIVGDIQALPLADASVSAVICLEVIEHVEDPRKAISELYRVLKPGATVLASAPFIWPYHAAPEYKDYWRFSTDGLKSIFSNFSSVKIVRKGGWCSALVNFIPSYTHLDEVFRPLAHWIDDHVSFGRSIAPGHFIIAVK